MVLLVRLLIRAYQWTLSPLLATPANRLAVFSGRALPIIVNGLVVSTFGYLSGMALAVPRALFAFARDGFLPRQLASVHPAWKTPWIAIAVQVSLTCALAITSGFGALAIISNVAALLVYFACAVAASR